MGNHSDFIHHFLSSSSEKKEPEKVEKKQDNTFIKHLAPTPAEDVIDNPKFLNALSNLLGKEKFDAFFASGVQVNEITQDGTLKIQVDTLLKKQMIEEFFESQVRKALYMQDQSFQRIKVSTGTARIIQNEEPKEISKTTEYERKALNTSIVTSTQDQAEIKSAKEAKFTLDVTPSHSGHQALGSSAPSSLLVKPDLTASYGQNIDKAKVFENFVVGPSNHMVYSACEAISKKPGKVYSSLYIHGHSGLGKTHLLCAIANKISELFPEKRLCMISAKKLSYEYSKAISEGKRDEFSRFYTQFIDVLMLDDIQELKGKKGTQDLFFHIFNELYNNGKQLIFTSDKTPKEIDGLPERISTRLSWGLVLDIQRPEIETRIAILKKKAHEQDILIPDEVIQLVAEHFNNNVRDLESSLLKLGYYSDLMGIDVDIETASEQLNLGQIVSNTSGELTLDRIAEIVSNFFQIPKVDILSRSRTKEISYPRQIAMYLSYKFLEMTLSEIGKYYSNRDHSSVLHAVDKIKKQMEKNLQLKSDIKSIQELIND